MRRFTQALPALLLLVAAGSGPLTAQTAPGTAAPAAATPPVFSGLIFGSYSFQPSTTDAQRAGQVDNEFSLDRAYLTFRMPAGERTSMRITTDIYQTTEATSNAYTIRAKYAYLQYDAPRTASGASVTGRIGILQNVVIESQEAFWPRYFSQVPVEKAGYFSSADVGVASLVSLPNQLGEVYGTVVNGPGYTSRERDRFKDVALRLTLTPLAHGSMSSPLLRNLTITAWGYRGAVASSFVNGGTGQVGNVGASLDRSRAGLFVGVRDSRLTLAGEIGQRYDGSEQGANTLLSPRMAGSTTGRLLAAYSTVRPLAYLNATGRSPVGVVVRYDRVQPTASSDDITPAPASANRYHNIIAGVFWDLSQKAQLALDYQESLASDNGVSRAPPSQMKGYFAHFNVSF